MTIGTIPHDIGTPMRAYGKNKRDANERDVIDELEAYGFAVYQMDQPCDLLAGRGGVNYLIEVKDGPKAKLTEKQRPFHDTWPGQIDIIRSVEDAAAWCQLVRAVRHG